VRIKALIIIIIAVNFNGYNSVVWNADSQAYGVYFIKMAADEYIKHS